jgi:hypothetical protein
MGNEYRELAPAVKHQGSHTGRNLLILFGLVAALVAIAPEHTPAPVDKAQEDAELNNRMAYQECAAMIRHQAHDPESVSFPQSYAQTVIDKHGPEYTAYIPTRARNGFGAMRLSTVKCIVRAGENDSFAVIYLR